MALNSNTPCQRRAELTLITEDVPLWLSVVSFNLFLLPSHTFFLLPLIYHQSKSDGGGGEGGRKAGSRPLMKVLSTIVRNKDAVLY